MDRWRRLSIATKLPLGIGALLLGVLGGMTALAYLEVRRGALLLAEERLNRTSQQFAEGLAADALQRLALLTQLSEWPPLARYLTGSDGVRAQLADTLRAYARQREAELEVRDAAGKLVFAIGADGAPTGGAPAAPTAMPSVEQSGRGAVGPFEREGDDLYYTVVAGVGDGDRVVGSLRDRRLIRASREQARAVSELVGAEARLLIGNVTGDVWMDLAGPAQVPPLAVRESDSIVTYATDTGVPVMARALPVPSTPWLLVLEFARGPVLAPADRFLRQAILLSLLFSAAGAAVAWLLSRRMSLPLQRVTAAAETMAGGHDAPPLDVRREDEIGRLATSFNTMAVQVAESRRELERRVAERTRALEAANRELEAFSYSVSHDLRAPLRAVDGFAGVLVEDHLEELSDEAQRFVGLIRSSAQQMGQLIDDLLTFSRLGRQSLRLNPIDMDALVRGVVVECCERHGRDFAEFTIEQLPPAAGERSMLKQVVANYVENALKFTKHRQRATIRITGRAAHGETIYSVSDNGVGFDMRYADKLFGVFQRLHSPEDFQGTGVGLAIVKRVVERHGGRVWAEGEPDVGATFYFALPNGARIEAEPQEVT